MRGGMVAGGVFLVFLGFSWWYVLAFAFRLGVPGATVGIMDAVYLVCVLPIVFIIIGFMVFLAGLIGKSQAELAAMRAPYPMFPMPYPVQPPPMILVQQPPSPPQHLGRGTLRRPPPPPS